MKIKCLKNVGCKGENLVAGKTYDVEDADGRYLIITGKAEAVADKKAKAKK
jgi:hypothetical protein